MTQKIVDQFSSFKSHPKLFKSKTFLFLVNRIELASSAAYNLIECTDTIADSDLDSNYEIDFDGDHAADIFDFETIDVDIKTENNGTSMESEQMVMKEEDVNLTIG